MYLCMLRSDHSLRVVQSVCKASGGRLGQGRARVISCPQSRRPDARQLRTNALCLKSLNSHAPPSRRIARKASAMMFCRVRRACSLISMRPPGRKRSPFNKWGRLGRPPPPAALREPFNRRERGQPWPLRGGYGVCPSQRASSNHCSETSRAPCVISQDLR